MDISASRRTPLRGLYAIADTAAIPAGQLAAHVGAALRGGARLVQYRDKSGDAARRLAEASELLDLCRKHRVPLLINDDYKLCAAIGADGVHLGREDTALGYARSELGPRAIIGASCYNAAALAETAAEHGADYVAFGAFFPSANKPQAVRAYPRLLHEARRRTGLPVCAIGGITLDNAAGLIGAGADMLAVIGGLFSVAPGAADHPSGSSPGDGPAAGQCLDIQSVAARFGRLFDSAAPPASDGAAGGDSATH